MVIYILKRLIATFLTILLVISITFFLMHIIPGGPFNLMYEDMSAESISVLNARYHLDDSTLIQFINYVVNIFKGDLGPSFQRLGVSVNDILVQSFPISAKLGAIAVLVVIILGMTLGIISAFFQNKYIDIFITAFITLGTTTPNFVIATLVLYLFSNKLAILPSYGLSTWKHYIGPVITLSLLPAAFLTRLISTSLKQVLKENYIRTCNANGLPKYRVLFKHVLPNALLPVLAYLGPTIASILTGSFVIEKVFSIPGMGKYFVESVGNRDYTVLMGTTLLYSILVVGIIFLIDIIYIFIDPRIKLKN